MFQKEKKDSIYSIRFSRSVKNTLREIADREHRSLASLINKIIIEYLESQELKPETDGVKEMRRYPRKETDHSAYWEMTQRGELRRIKARLNNLSLGGALTTYQNGRTMERIWSDLGDDLSLHFNLPDQEESLNLPCRVIHSRRDRSSISLGLQYQDIGSRIRSCLQEWMEGKA